MLNFANNISNPQISCAVLNKVLKHFAYSGNLLTAELWAIWSNLFDLPFWGLFLPIQPGSNFFFLKSRKVSRYQSPTRGVKLW